jgi:hypothetical protein
VKNYAVNRSDERIAFLWQSAISRTMQIWEGTMKIFCLLLVSSTMSVSLFAGNPRYIQIDTYSKLLPQGMRQPLDIPIASSSINIQEISVEADSAAATGFFRKDHFDAD